VLLADLPGLAPDSLDVHVEGNSLILAGERRLDEEIKEENFHRMERGYGPFRRSFTLPATIRQDGIRAEHRNGVLRVTLPKAESTRPKKIKVETGS
jgi:HSP20 family protein